MLIRDLKYDDLTNIVELLITVVWGIYIFYVHSSFCCYSLCPFSKSLVMKPWQPHGRVWQVFTTEKWAVLLRCLHVIGCCNPLKTPIPESGRGKGQRGAWQQLVSCSFSPLWRQFWAFLLFDLFCIHRVTEELKEQMRWVMHFKQGR